MGDVDEQKDVLKSVRCGESTILLLQKIKQSSKKNRKKSYRELVDEAVEDYVANNFYEDKDSNLHQRKSNKKGNSLNFG